MEDINIMFTFTQDLNCESTDINLTTLVNFKKII